MKHIPSLDGLRAVAILVVLMEMGKEVALFLGSALAMGIAWLSWRYVEAPMLRRRDRKMGQP